MRQTPPRSAVLLTTLVIALCGAGALAGAALADTSVSTNWAGYVAHRAGVRFRRIDALWTEPSPVCTRGSSTFSATWVGLGGVSDNSSGLEQIGTDADCSASGRTIADAWYELLPAPSVPIRMTVRPGDVISAEVTVVGHRATLALGDRTRGTLFRRTFTAGSIDVSSADWIVEAPSGCLSADVCRTLPLADFGRVKFAHATARTTTGHSAPIASPFWGTTQTIMARNHHFAPASPDTQAVPSSLSPDGTAFSIDFLSSASNPVPTSPPTPVPVSGARLQR